MSGRRLGFGMGAKFSLLAFVIVVTSVAAVAGFSLYEMRAEAARQANLSLNQRLLTLHTILAGDGAAFHLEGDALMVGGRTLNGDYAPVDTIQAIFGGTATIFMRDERISTNVKTDTGARAIGTKLTGAVHDVIFKDHAPYRGEAMILGAPYFTAYDPLTAPDGQVIGILYAGVQRAEYLQSFERAARYMVVLACALVIIFCLVALLFGARIVRPLKVALQAFNRMADGDLTQSLRTRSRDEVGRLSAAFNGMAGKLNALMGQVQESAVSVGSATDQISQRSQRLVDDARQQAVSLEQTSASVEELSSSMTGVSEHARSQTEAAAASTETMNELSATIERISQTLVKVAAAAQEATEKAQEGVGSVEKVVSSIQGIASSSEQIAGILTVIRDIADQTNLLALNASIEAARAGEHGKGFAVVAQEVSKLADRSTTSTKEIVGLIAQSEKAVADGVQIASGSLSSMEAIIGGSRTTNAMVAALKADLENGIARIREVGKAIADVSGMSHSISQATAEQTQGAQEVARAVEQVSTLTQQTATAADEMSEAADGMAKLAKNLQDVVRQFTLRRETDGVVVKKDAVTLPAR
jgi:methyl-accepting chemotaxis protein